MSSLPAGGDRDESPVAHAMPAAPGGGTAGLTAAPARSRGRATMRRVGRSPGALLGLGMLVVAVGVSALGPFVPFGGEWGPTDQDIANLGVPPGVGGHLLGTDAGGFDLYANLVAGTGRSLLIAAAVGVGTPLLGGIYGAAIALWGGRRERVGLWVLDMLLVMPAFLVAALVAGATGGSALVLAVLLIALGWMPLARVVRAMTHSLRTRDYVRAARYQGVGTTAVIRRHILPNLGSFLVLCVVLGMSSAIVTETALSYLGLGVRPPDVSLGQLIGRASGQLAVYPWLFWGPTVCLVWITLGLALVGDGVRDALDPRSRASGG